MTSLPMIQRILTKQQWPTGIDSERGNASDVSAVSANAGGRGVVKGPHLFKNSSKEGATPYIDWRNCVDELVADKLDEARIRSLVMQSLEGPPKDTA